MTKGENARQELTQEEFDRLTTELRNSPEAQRHREEARVERLKVEQTRKIILGVGVLAVVIGVLFLVKFIRKQYVFKDVVFGGARVHPIQRIVAALVGLALGVGQLLHCLDYGFEGLAPAVWFGLSIFFILFSIHGLQKR